MNWLQKVIGQEWNIVPAGGLTGDAFIAEYQQQRMFLKRNSSPFLAVLSAEGIVPKLMWTKRLENGDVLTAQEWLKGRELRTKEVQEHNVAKLLHHIHHSSELLYMLLRMGKQAVTADDIYARINNHIQQSDLQAQYPIIQRAMQILNQVLPAVRNQELVVCHCDLNHNNLLLTEVGDLYLIDWDNAMIADPAIDIGMVLHWYVSPDDWNEWLLYYGIVMNDNLLKRMYWYLIADTLHYVNWHIGRDEHKKVNERLEGLQGLLDAFEDRSFD